MLSSSTMEEIGLLGVHTQAVKSSSVSSSVTVRARCSRSSENC